ncbi:MAG TPA: response regulator, partial [Noviherbaspirillum sp.]
MNDKTLHVLFVEDSEDDMELLLDTLRREYGDIVHHRVDSAARLHAALDQRTWDVVLCDHNLPALDAPAALRIVQGRRADIPFIIVSGSIGDDAAAATMMSGAADMINKDKLYRLVPAIRRELEKSATVGDLRAAREHIRQIEHYDQLTGLPNRDFLARRIDGMIAFHCNPCSFALVAINISRFLLIPRTLGIDAANQTLRLVGERIRKCVGDTGL